MAQSRSRLKILIAGALGITVFAIPFLHAQSQKYMQAQQEAAPKTQSKARAPAKADNQTRNKPGVPNKAQLQLLIQTYMVALSQANLTGNYTVLHALGAPDFQKNNPPEKLFEVFSVLRKQNVDLTPIILRTPTLTRDPVFGDNGMLPLAGYYATEPQQIHFDLTLEPVAGVWRLFAISVKTVPAAKRKPQPGAENDDQTKK